MKNRILISILVGIFLMNNIFTQECDPGFSYYSNADIPDDVTILDQSNCFSTSNLDVLNDLIDLNMLNYDSPLDVGVQTWEGGSLYRWVASYSPNGTNGVNEQLTQLPDNIGLLSNLTQLFLEENLIFILPGSFTQLSNLENLTINQNWLTSLPSDLGNLSSLTFADFGYNQINHIPESIGNLANIDYLWLFNNQIFSLPESICDLPLTWSGSDYNNYPYFAIGGNLLCDNDLIPDCVQNSNNFEISLDQFYYSFQEVTPQDCIDCSDLGDVNGDQNYNVLDVVTLVNCVLASSCVGQEGCPNDSSDLNGDGNYNVLDIVILANCILSSSCGGRIDDASESRIIMENNMVSIEADGFIGGVQLTLTHGVNFKIEMTDRALLADYITKGNETRLLVITPETDELFSYSGNFEIAEIIVANSHSEVSADLPIAIKFSLSDAYPNPFNPTTSMELSMPIAGDVQVEVHNLLGQSIATLTSGYKEIGSYNLTWDASDVSSGMYFIKAQTEGFTTTQKLMLIK